MPGPRVDHDMYATIGFERANEVEVNFGSSDFLWREARGIRGNDVAWRVDGHTMSAAWLGVVLAKTNS
jgi:hypothetical protein